MSAPSACGGVGGGVFIADTVETLGCWSIEELFFGEFCAIVDFGFGEDLISVSFDRFGAVAGAIFFFFFFGLSSASESDVLASFMVFDDFFLLFEFDALSCSLFF